MYDPQIIGITGAFGSGKSTAADYLESIGYKKIILSKFLEDALVYSGEKKITRKKLQNLGNYWRSIHGPSVLANRAIEIILKEKPEKVVVDGFRNIYEIEEFRKFKNFTLIALLVNRNLRFKRLFSLKRREKLTPELFKKLDYKDIGIGENINGLQVAACIAISDIFIENNLSKEKLLKKLGEVIDN